MTKAEELLLGSKTEWGEAAGREHKEVLKNLGAMDSSQTCLWGWLHKCMHKPQLTKLYNCVLYCMTVYLTKSVFDKHIDQIKVRISVLQLN